MPGSIFAKPCAGKEYSKRSLWLIAPFDTSNLDTTGTWSRFLFKLQTPARFWPSDQQDPAPLFSLEIHAAGCLLLTATFGFELWGIEPVVLCTRLFRWLAKLEFCKHCKPEFAVFHCLCCFCSVFSFYLLGVSFFAIVSLCVARALPVLLVFLVDFFFFWRDFWVCNVWPFCSHVWWQQLPSQANACILSRWSTREATLLSLFFFF